MKHIYTSFNNVEFCETENDYKHIQSEIESLEGLVAELEDIYAEEFYAVFRKKLERFHEIESTDGTLSITEKEGMAKDEIQLDTVQDFYNREDRQKPICGMEKILK